MTTAPRIRVAYVVPDLAIGGAERHVTTLMTRLDRTRFDPLVVCLGREGELFGSLAAAGVPAVALGRSKRQALWCLLDLVRLLRAAAPDVVIVRGFNAEVLGRVAAVVARVPRVVVWVHNCGDLEPRGFVRTAVDRLLDPLTSAYFGVARAQLPYLRDELHYPSRKTAIIHNGVDPEPFRAADRTTVRDELGIADDDLVVGVLAALREEKDHESFLVAAAQVLDQVPSARFLVVGDGPRRPGLEQLAQDLGVAGRTSFVGARHDVPAVLAAMDVFVLSSFTIECFPMALLEAMASSRAAVCTAVGGIPELLEDGVTGYLVPPREPERLAARLVELLGSEQRRLEYGAAARARVEAHFTLERSVAEAERQLLRVVGDGDDDRDGPVKLALVLDETFVGGVETLMLEVFRAFDPDVVEPRLICLRSGGPLAADYRAAGFAVDVVGHRGRFDPRTLPRLTRLLRGSGTDAVLVTHHHRASLALGRAAALLAGVGVNLVAVHDMDLVASGQRCLPVWAVATLRVSDALVLLAESQGEYLHRDEGVGRSPWSRTREVVIPNGVVLPPLPGPADQAAARDRLGLDQDAFVIGIVARLSAQKAHHVLFEAFAVLRRRHSGARLVVVGGGSREAELRGLAARLELEDAILFTGVRRDVPALLPAFDVSCLSSVHEGVPMAAIESMARGIPLVTTDCGALREMVGDGEQGFVVPVGDSAAMAERLGRLADDPALRARLGRSARQRVQDRYRLDQTARGYERLLRDLVARR